MWQALKSLAMAYLNQLLLDAVSTAVKVAEIKAVSFYVKAVDGVRRVLVSFLLGLAAIMLFLTAFIGLHVGIFVLSGWSLRTIGVIVLCLSAVYVIAGTAIMTRAVSQKTWMRLSHADELVRRAAMKDDRT